MKLLKPNNILGYWQVVEAALARGGEAELVALMARFRRAFVDALQPRFLSPSWQIEHRCACGRAPCRLLYAGYYHLSKSGT